MVKPESHSKKAVNKGAWTAEEDRRLSQYIKVHGDKKWRSIPARAGLSAPFSPLMLFSPLTSSYFLLLFWPDLILG